jgi:hypothetical protein
VLSQATAIIQDPARRTHCPSSGNSLDDLGNSAGAADYLSELTMKKLIGKLK